MRTSATAAVIAQVTDQAAVPPGVTMNQGAPAYYQPPKSSDVRWRDRRLDLNQCAGCLLPDYVTTDEGPTVRGGTATIDVTDWSCRRSK